MTKPPREQLLERITFLERTVDEQLFSAARGALHIVRLEERIAELDAEVKGQSWINRVRGSWIEDPLRKQVEVLEERIRKAKAVMEITEDREIPSICWQIAKEVRAALDGEDEETVEPVLELVNPADVASIAAMGRVRNVQNVELEPDDEWPAIGDVIAYVVRDPNTGGEVGYPPEAVRIVRKEQSHG